MSHENDDSSAGEGRPAAEPEPREFAEARRVRPGLAWERRAELGPGRAFAATIYQVLFAPGAAFRDMKTGGGWGEPLGFAVVIGSIGIWVAQAWDMLMRSFLIGVGGVGVQEIAAANAQEIWFAFFAPFLVCAATFFGAGIVHLLLMMLGGAPQPYETTFRVMCYTWSATVFNLVPICGIFVAGVWRIVTQIIGLREAQGVPTGRAAAAVLIPLILACFCLLVLLIVVVGAGGLDLLAL